MIYAKYTIVLKTLLDDPKTKAMIDEALSTYPVITPKNPENITRIPTREEINQKILNYYKYREIGFETIGRFLDELEIAMCEIMPYYNQKFKSEDIINGVEDIFKNLDVTEQFDQETAGTSSATSTGSSTGNTSSETSGTNSDSSESNVTQSNNSSSTNSNNSEESSKHIKSQTPQSELSITAANIDSVSYADEVDWNKANNSSSGTGSETSTGTSKTNTSSEGSNSATSTGTSSEESTAETSGTTSGTNSHTLKRTGNQGVNTYAHDMLEFRELNQNVIQEIIHDERISELFMRVY